MASQHIKKLSKIIEKYAPDSRLVLDEESEKGLFVILGSWEDLGEINFQWNRLRKVFRSWKRVYELSDKIWPQTGGPFADLRLGRIRPDREGNFHLPNTANVQETFLKLAVASVMAGRLAEIRAHPSSSSSNYEVPEGIEELGSDMGIASCGFNDEYDACGNCAGLIRTSANSYIWQPDFWEDDDERICHNCVREHYREDYLDSFVNQNRLLNDCVVDPGEFEFVKLERDFESGFHPGQDDDPGKVIAGINDAGFDIVLTGSVEQFCTNREVWARPQEKTPLEKEAWAERANEALDNLDSYQGFSTAQMTAKALKTRRSNEGITYREWDGEIGENSEFIMVEK